MNLTFPQFWNLLSLYSWFNNSNKKLIYRRDSARCECRNPRPCLSIIYPSAVYNLHPLNSHTYYLVIYLFISICVKNASPSLHIHTTSLFQMDGKRRLGSGGHASVSSAQNIGLSNRELKSALNCTVWSQCTLVPDRRTDGQTGGGTLWQ